MLSAGISSTDSIISARTFEPPLATGAKVTPQFPKTTEVTPCQHEELAIGSQASWASKWVCTSTKPGVTILPSASISFFPFSSTFPISTIRSSFTATSAVKAWEPVPSMTEPPLITKSNVTCIPLVKKS